jgi:hypothetical protein
VLDPPNALGRFLSISARTCVCQFPQRGFSSLPASASVGFQKVDLRFPLGPLCSPSKINNSRISHIGRPIGRREIVEVWEH